MKTLQKEKAISLRKKGFTYSEILREVPVAKSTLSLWLRAVGMSKRQEQKFTLKKREASKRGGLARRKQRLDITDKIRKKAIEDINSISSRELWLMGTMLYWAEGSKAKEHFPSQGIIFSNSDPMMIRLFLKWLDSCLNVTKEDITLEIYIHQSSAGRIKECKKFWATTTGFPEANFDKIYFKKDKLKTRRKNKGDKYFGLVRIRVKKSTNLNRQIEGWIRGVCLQCGVV